MNAPLVIVDTETTSLRRDRRAWEVAMIRIDGDGITEWQSYIRDVDLSEADPASLKIGRFHERHPSYRPDRLAPGDLAHFEEGASGVIENWTRGTTIVGAVPNFDTEVLADMLRRHNMVPAWHYHLIDVETLVAGWLHAMPRVDWLNENLSDDLLVLPWKSNDLSRAVGVNPDDFDRHTALGDCKWVLAQLEAVAPDLIAAAKVER